MLYFSTSNLKQEHNSDNQFYINNSNCSIGCSASKA